jgi:glycosyltransferase involved in cell wall biosynthesis
MTPAPTPSIPGHSVNPSLRLSVIIPTHNPHSGRLQRTLSGLQAQTLAPDQWETLLIDNASTPPLVLTDWTAQAPANLRLVSEPKPGLSHARQRGFSESRGEFAVLVDDDNVLAPDYLANVLSLFQQHPRIGLLGGRSLPEFEVNPPAWTGQFHSLLALRDLGSESLISRGLRPDGSDRNEYPAFAPIGAGMGLRRIAWTAWLKARHAQSNSITDRQGSQLTSGGDNDIVLQAMRAGLEVGYFPSLSLTHLIPPFRTERAYLGALNRAIARSWIQVLARHDIRPWQPIAPATVFLRQCRAWWRARAWRSDSAWVTWQGWCGTFEGQADLARIDHNSPPPPTGADSK